MTAKIAGTAPSAAAPLIRNPKTPQRFRLVLWEHHLMPIVAENLATLLGVSVDFLPDSLIAARWDPRGFPARSTWAIARFRVTFEQDETTAFLFQPLAEALDWGAIGLRRPPATRSVPEPAKDGALVLSEAETNDLLAYHEVCNVVTCGVLARAWRSKLERSLVILLDDVQAATPATFPPELAAAPYVVLQAGFGYSERPVRPVKGQPPQHEKQAVWLFVLPEALAVQTLWGMPDGKEKQKTDWLLTTGLWRWAK
ncbi:hypothetical protein [Thermorudis peleae]|uniref:hypothetical protein n=1 Tax=Thermorudis peleae TaxID=1382356 RepID=UPI00056DC40C|nr:hypothetical protein [Thermorudis peleae]